MKTQQKSNRRPPHHTRRNPIESAIALLLALSLGGTISNALAVETNTLPGLGVQPVGYFYTGKPYDMDSETYTFKYRNYDPEVNRWTSMDPTGFPDGPNNQYYAPTPTAQMDALGLTTYSLQLFWHWLTGNGSTVNLPWNAFDPDNTTRNLAGTGWRSNNLGLLGDIGHSAAFGSSSASPQTTQSTAPGFSIDEPAISQFTVFGYLVGGISINKYMVEDSWQADLTWTLGFSAIDIFDFNPGDDFGPYGFLKDDWFLALQEFSGIPQDFSVVSYTEDFKSHTVFE